MKKLLKTKLFSNAFIFTISSILNKGINFLILPVLTHYLTKDDYGHLGFVVSVVAITSIYIGLWPQNFIMTKFISFGREKLSRYMSNIFLIVMITFLLVEGVMFVSKDLLFNNFDNSNQLIFLIGVYTLFVVIFNIFNIIAQMEKNAIRYAFFQFFYLSLSLSLALFLIIKLNFDWKGKFYSELFILFFITIYSFYFFIKNRYLTFDIDIKKIKEIVVFLFPLTFSIVSLFLISTTDKIILAKYLDMQSVGIYTIAMTMAIVINIIFDSVINAWSPYFFEKVDSDKKEDKRFLKLSMIYYGIFVVISALLYILIVPYIFHIMIDEKFNSSLEYIPYLVVGFAFEGLRKPLNSFLMHKNKVNILASLSLVIAFLNIVLNIFLIQKFQIFGATYATIFSFALFYILTLVLVFRYYRF